MNLIYSNNNNFKTRNPIFSYKFFNIIILPFLLIILTTFIYDAYFETNDDFTISLLLKGDIQSQGGNFDISNLFLINIVYVYSVLYNSFPQATWYSYSLFLFNLIASINFFYIIDLSISKYFNNFINTFVFIFIFFIIILENIIEINFTRTAILLGGSSLLALFVMLTVKNGFNIKKYIAINIILFIIALLIRPMAGLLISVFLLPVIIYVLLKSNKGKISFYFLALLYLVIILLYSYTQYFRPCNEREIIEFISKVTNIMDYDYETSDIKFNNQDSIKKEAIKYLFIADKQKIDSEFLDRISSSHYISYNKFNIARIKTAIIYTAYYMYRDYPGISVLYIFILITVISAYFKKSKFDFLYILVIQLIYFIFIISIHIFMKLPDRIFLPLYGIVIVCNIILINFSGFKYKNKNIIVSTIVIIVLSSILSFYSMNVRYGDLKLLNIENNECFSSLEKKYNNTTFLITQPSSILFDGHNSLKNFSFNNNKIFPLIGWTTIMPSYYLEIKKMCNSLNINDLFNYLKNKPDYLLISNDKFNGFLATYFQLLYYNEIKFIQVSETPEKLKKRNLYLYKVIAY